MSDAIRRLAEEMLDVGEGVRTCRHCGKSIVPANTSTGWTHGPEDPPLWRNWQGVRCPGRLTGAQPVDAP